MNKANIVNKANIINIKKSFCKWYNYKLSDKQRMYSYCEDIVNLINNICCDKNYEIVINDDKFLTDLTVILFLSSTG